MSKLKKFLKKAGNVAKKVAPIVGGLVVAGPAGAALGAKLGGVAGAAAKFATKGQAVAKKTGDLSAVLRNPVPTSVAPAGSPGMFPASSGAALQDGTGFAPSPYLVEGVNSPSAMYANWDFVSSTGSSETKASPGILIGAGVGALALLFLLFRK
jgi:hypothetical protein